MGTNTSSQSQVQNASLQQQQQNHPTIQHQRFRQCPIHPQQPHIITRVKMDFSMFQYQYWQKNLQLIKQDPCSDMLFLPISYETQHPLITCGTGDNLKLTFANYPFILQQQIRNRSITSPPNYLQQQQLWMLLYTLVRSQHSFSNLSLKVGDIHPHNIFINSQGYPKLACQFSYPNEKSNFQKMYYDKKFRYLSPQEMKLCQQGQKMDVCYANTSEAFSIGLTMLGAGILESLDRVCDLRTFRFNRRYLQQCVNKWMHLKYRGNNQNNNNNDDLQQQQQQQQFITYSDELKDIVRGLCQVDVNKRYLISMVYQLLRKYQQQIINLEKFKIEGYFEELMVMMKSRNKNDNAKDNDLRIRDQLELKRNTTTTTTTRTKNNNNNNNNNYQQHGKQQQQTNHYKSMFNHYSQLNKQPYKQLTNLNNHHQIVSSSSPRFNKSNNNDNSKYNSSNILISSSNKEPIINHDILQKIQQKIKQSQQMFTDQNNNNPNNNNTNNNNTNNNNNKNKNSTNEDDYGCGCINNIDNYNNYNKKYFPQTHY